MNFWSGNANALSADLKRTAHRVRAVHDNAKPRTYVQIDGKNFMPELKPRDRHNLAHRRPVPYKMM